MVVGNKSKKITIRNRKETTMDSKITREQLIATAIDHCYNPLAKNGIVEEATDYILRESRFKGADDLTDLILQCAQGESDRDIYLSPESAADYFERYKGEINEVLGTDGDPTDPMNIQDFDPTDPLILRAHNKMVITQWAFVWAMGIIADWFDLEW